MILATTGVSSASTVVLSPLLPSPLTQPTWPVKWLTYGQKKEVVSVPGIIATDNASNGWSLIWIWITTTSWEVWPDGKPDMVFHTTLLFGLLITWAWWVTAMNNTILWKLYSQVSQNLSDYNFNYLNTNSLKRLF